MCTSAAHHVEAVVVGAGVVGLAVARTLSMAGREVLLIDRASSFGTETSSRNSEVIHAGLYYPSSSSKARFCVKGRKSMYQYCDERGISYNPCGKLVVATWQEEAQQTRMLQALHEQAQQNGVTETRILNAQDVHAMEPSLKETAHSALWSPVTGIIDSHHFMQCLLADAEAGGATIAFHTDVEDAALERITTGSNQSQHSNVKLKAGGMWLACKFVVNCAGLWADHIARRIHQNQNNQDQESCWTPPRQYYCKGNYFRLQGVKSPFSHLIYPLPDERGGGLGVHATLEHDPKSTAVKFGPDTSWLDPAVETPDGIDLIPDANRANAFYKSIRTYWPDLPNDSLVPDYVGVRPKLQHPSMLEHGDKLPFQDFFIAGPKEHGVPGVFHLLGIESPGLTSSLAIAEYIGNEREASSS